MPTNLVTNGGFETGDLTGWSVSDSGGPGNLDGDIGVDSQPEDVNSGSYGLYAGNANTVTLSQDIPTTPGHRYTISFALDVYQADATDGSFTATFGGQTVTFLAEPSETDTFTIYTATVETHVDLTPLTFSFVDPGGYFGLDDISVVDAGLACFATGTLIATPSGQVAVQSLAPGDAVSLASGGTTPVVWIGHRRVHDANVIRIRAHALGDRAPSRDLIVSPDHAMLVGECLVPAGLLADAGGDGIVREHRDEVTFWHVELAQHAILLAENAPAESYLDTGNRRQFANCALGYDPVAAVGDPCVEVVFGGERLDIIQAGLRSRVPA